MAKNLYHEACQISEVMQQKVLQWEPPVGRYATSKIPHTFPMEKPFKNMALKFITEQIGG